MITDIRPIGTQLYFLPVTTRVPLKFGPETLTSVICARVKMTVSDVRGRTAEGWGETPLSVQWVWPSSLSYQYRCDALQDFCRILTTAWAQFTQYGHPLEVGDDFFEQMLPNLLRERNSACTTEQAMPWLAAIVCCSAFDIAMHDAYGQLHQVDVYKTYNRDFLNRDLSAFVVPAKNSDISFAGRYPADFLNLEPPSTLPAWHLVGGMDLLDESQRTGTEPNDGYPVTLPEWIVRDGLFCLKVKLRGNDAAWDYDRLIRVGRIAVEHNVLWLTADFNCTVTDPAYVNVILDRLKLDQPRIYQMILYVEQPFPYDLEHNRIAVHSVSAVHGRKRPRLAGRAIGTNAGMDGRGAEDLQDPDGSAAFAVLGKGPRHDADGTGSDQSDAGPDPACASGGACGYHHGC
jgi:L-alanine-DL-glutamate epimerase-like enolase superfamily enzyme